MEVQYYQKGKKAQLDADFRAARQFGKIRLGKEFIYGRRLLRWQQVPLAEIAQLWQHIQQVQSHTSCCEADFNIHRLHLRLKDASEVVMLIGDELFRHEDLALLEAVSLQNPEIVIGTPKKAK